MQSLNHRRFHFLVLLFSLFTISLGASSTVNAQTTTPAPSNNAESGSDRPNSLLSLQGGEKLMAEAETAINNQQYDTAVDKLQKARQVFNQLSNFYLELATSFSGIDNSIAESQKQKALETGQMRDNATYKLALVHRAQEKPELSVPLLVQVIKSQNPTSDLGKKSYQQLLEMGFVNVPFSASNPSNPAPNNSAPANPAPANPGNANDANNNPQKSK
jgi:hypothetical protein